jgi:hypothetical protein
VTSSVGDQGSPVRAGPCPGLAALARLWVIESPATSSGAVPPPSGRRSRFLFSLASLACSDLASRLSMATISPRWSAFPSIDPACRSDLQIGTVVVATQRRVVGYEAARRGPSPRGGSLLVQAQALRFLTASSGRPASVWAEERVEALILQGGRLRRNRWPSTGGNGHLRLSLLGEFKLTSLGININLPAGSQRLVAFLALRNRSVRRTVVAGTVWPDASEANAHAALRSALFRLQAATRDVVGVTPLDLRLADGTGRRGSSGPAALLLWSPRRARWSRPWGCIAASASRRRAETLARVLRVDDICVERVARTHPGRDRGLHRHPGR